MPKPKRKQPAKKSFPVWGWGLLAIIAVAGIAVILFSQVKPAPAPLPDEITVAQAAEMRSKGAFLLDVRQPEEWQQFHIPGATLIPLGDLPARLKEVPRDREVVVVCRTGHRSAQGRDILRNAGYTRVTSMAGGVTQWQAQGLEIAAGQ